MSLPNTGYGTVRKLRQASIGSGSSPRLIPRSSDSYQDGLANPLLNVVPTAGRERANSISSVGSREPTRSSVHLSYRGSHGRYNAAVYEQWLNEMSSTRRQSPASRTQRARRYCRVSIIRSIRSRLYSKSLPSAPSNKK